METIKDKIIDVVLLVLLLLAAGGLLAIAMYRLVIDAQCQQPDGTWQYCIKRD